MEKEYKGGVTDVLIPEIPKEQIPKKCTWNGCKKIARHQGPGSIMALCDNHNEEMNDNVKGLF